MRNRDPCINNPLYKKYRCSPAQGPIYEGRSNKKPVLTKIPETCPMGTPCEIETRLEYVKHPNEFYVL